MPNMMERLAAVDKEKATAKDHALSVGVPLTLGAAGAIAGGKWKHKSLQASAGRPLKTEEELMEIGDAARVKILGGIGLGSGALAVRPFMPQKEQPDLQKAAFDLSQAMERYVEKTGFTRL